MQSIMTVQQRKNRYHASKHAQARWRLRVDSRASHSEARAAILHIAATGRRIATARGWTARAIRKHGTGAVAIVSAAYPDVALIARGDVIVTVLTRGLCERRPDRPHRMGQARRSWSDGYGSAA